LGFGYLGQKKDSLGFNTLFLMKTNFLPGRLLRGFSLPPKEENQLEGKISYLD